MGIECFYNPISGENASGLLVFETSDPTSPTIKIPVVLDLIGDLTEEDPMFGPEQVETHLIVKPNPVRISPVDAGPGHIIELCLASVGMEFATDVMISTEGDSFSLFSVDDSEGNNIPIPFDYGQHPSPCTIFVEYKPIENSYEDGKLIVEFTDSWGIRQTLKVPLIFQ